MPQEEHHNPARGTRTRAPLQRRLRVAAQPHLFAQPLIDGLRGSPEVNLTIISPPSLADMLLCCELDAALLPVVGLQEVSGLTVVPAGCVSCSGKTLVTRIFSRVRPEQLSTLWVDHDSRTSTVLAQVLWSHCFNTRLDILPIDTELQEAPDDAEGVLMVGDKVVTAPPLGFDWQIDLGSMWFEMTGLPFVFCVWAASDPDDCGNLYRILQGARLRGTRDLEAAARKHATANGWPADLAQQYLTKHLQFDFTDAQREGMEEFFHLAAECGAMDDVQPVRYYKP